MSNPLYQAALMGDINEVKGLLEQGVSVNTVNAQGNTPLHAAVVSMHEDLITLLLGQGAEVNATNRMGITPLGRAIINRELPVKMPAEDWGSSRHPKTSSIVRRLLKADADPNLGLFPCSSLDFCSYGYEHVVEKNTEFLHDLLAAGLDPDIQDPSGCTLLHRVCVVELPMIQRALPVLLAAGADINRQDRQGNTPLHHCLGHGEPDLLAVRLLVDSGADSSMRNRIGQTPLHVLCDGVRNAVQTGSHKSFPDIIKYLLSIGVSPEDKDNNGQTAFHLLAIKLKQMDKQLVRGYAKEIKIFFATNIVGENVFAMLAGDVADPLDPVKNPWTTRTQLLTRITRMLNSAVEDSEQAHTDSAWQVCVGALLQQDADALRGLLARYGDLMGGAVFYETLMGLVLRLGLAGAGLKTLLAAGYDIESQDTTGGSPLHMATAYGNREAEAVAMLLDRGADPDSINMHGSPVTALLRGALFPMGERNKDRSQTLRLLLEAGADPNIPNMWDQAPLQLVQHSTEAELLVHFGAKPGNVDILGRTRLHELLERNSSCLQFDPNYASLMRTLIRQGARHNTLDYMGHGPLHHMAVSSGTHDAIMTQTLSAYLTSGGDINETNRYGFTPLMAAVANQGNDIKHLVEILFSMGADPNAGICSLHHIYERDKEHMYTADPGTPPVWRGEYPEMRNRLPVMWDIDRRERLEMLVSLGLDVNRPHPGTGDTLLLCQARTGAPIKDMAYLLQHGADVHVRNHTGDTPLLAMLRHVLPIVGIVTLLLEHDSDPNAQDREGKSAMDLATAITHTKSRDNIIKLLLNYGVAALASFNEQDMVASAAP